MQWYRGREELKVANLSVKIKQSAFSKTSLDLNFSQSFANHISAKHKNGYCY